MKETGLYEFAHVKVLNLRGSWHEMGRQYGKLAAPMLYDVLSYLEAFMSQSNVKCRSIREMGKQLYRNNPSFLKRFFEGASETSGLSIDDLITVNAVEYAEGFFCSAMAMSGDYSRNGLVFGRNYDAGHYRELAKDLTVTVFHPDDGSLSTAIIGYAGELYAVNAINERGLLVELNNGMPSAGWGFDFDMIPATVLLLEMMLKANDMDYADAFLRTALCFSSFIIGVADSNEARAYEWCRQGVKRADICLPAGLMAITNHYMNPEWPFARPEDKDSWNSLTRLENMLGQAGRIKGKADAAALCRIMDTPLESGGPKHSLTRYQFVFEPQSMKLHIKTADSEQWSHIDMGEFLKC